MSMNFDPDKPSDQINQGNLETTGLQKFISAVANPGKTFFENAEGRDRELSSTELKYKKATIALFNTSIILGIAGICTLIIGITLSFSLPILCAALTVGILASMANIVSCVCDDKVATDFEFCRDTKLPELREKINQKTKEFQSNKFQTQIDEANKNLNTIWASFNKKNTNNVEQLDSYLKALSNNEAFCYTIAQKMLQLAEKNLSTEAKHSFVLRIRALDDISSEDQNVREGVVRQILGLVQGERAQESRHETADIKLQKTKIQNRIVELGYLLQGQTKSNENRDDIRQSGGTNPFDDPEEKLLNDKNYGQ
ncbi:MAG: hypothetical protein K2L13_03395 [Opitutales bacterium]|nr:hypothetical protein [Opitutales bacterium]